MRLAVVGVRSGTLPHLSLLGNLLNRRVHRQILIPMHGYGNPVYVYAILHLTAACTRPGRIPVPLQACYVGCKRRANVGQHTIASATITYYAYCINVSQGNSHVMAGRVQTQPCRGHSRNGRQIRSRRRGHAIPRARRLRRTSPPATQPALANNLPLFSLQRGR